MASLAGAVPVVVDTTTADGFLMSAQQLRAALTPRGCSSCAHLRTHPAQCIPGALRGLKHNNRRGREY